MTYDVVLVGCGSAKRDAPAAVRDLYTSNYFQLKRGYAESFGDDWRVLSAEHGVLHPDAEVAPYDTTMTDVDTDAWADDVLGSLAEYNASHLEPVRFTFLAGRDYLTPLRERVADRGLVARYPFDATSGIGEQMQWLKYRTEAEG